jgi:hypothetical protein
MILKIHPIHKILSTIMHDYTQHFKRKRYFPKKYLEKYHVSSLQAQKIF